MKNWVNNFHIKERYLKIKELSDQDLKFSKIKNIDDLTYLEQGHKEIVNQSE